AAALFRAVLFFFSSRRRHTSCYRDWSSDVCSSDLVLLADLAALDLGVAALHQSVDPLDQIDDVLGALGDLHDAGPLLQPQELDRSEERRVGKGGSSRWSRCE